MHSRRENPEARAWLTSNYSPSALATNRFHTTACALEFVNDLYAAGATEVLVDNIAAEIRPEDGGPYADSLIAFPFCSASEIHEEWAHAVEAM